MRTARTTLRCRGDRAGRARHVAWHLFAPGPDGVRRAAHRVRWPIITAPIRPACPLNLPMPTSIKRGEYLARAADCDVCHTAPRRRRPMPADLRSSCRSERSIRPTSRPTKRPASATTATPIFSTRCSGASARTARGFIRPCHITSYTYMTDADALAIKAYLFSLPPVHAPTAPTRSAFPFNQRWSMIVLVAGFQRQFALRAQHGAKPANGTGAPISPRRWRIAASATRRAIWLCARQPAESSPAR